MKLVMMVAVLWAFVGSASANTDDDTLDFFLSKSDLVIVAEITSQPLGGTWEPGVVHYICDLRVLETLAGEAPEQDTFKVNVLRFELVEDDRAPDLRKGGKGIFFLKRRTSGQIPAWQTADFWFGFQRASPWMARSLKRLAPPAISDGR